MPAAVDRSEFIWSRGEFWIQGRTCFNPHARRRRLVLSCDAASGADLAAVLITAIERLSRNLPDEERSQFEIQAAIVRATLREATERWPA